MTDDTLKVKIKHTEIECFAKFSFLDINLEYQNQHSPEGLSRD